MPSRNEKYPDLGWSYYPSKIDSRDGINNQGEEDLSEFAINEDFSRNVNYEDRDSSPTANDYYVLAEDVNVLQDAVLSIERILGQMPHVPTEEGDGGGIIDTNSVSERISLLEDPSRYDGRFGGDGWEPEMGQTILSHEHLGGSNGAPLINLGTMTTGQLRKDQLQLGVSDEDPLTSEHIPYTSSDERSIKTLLGTKFDKNGGTISDNLVVQGNVNCRAFGEIDCKDMIGSGSTSGLAINTADAEAYCGEAKYFSKTAGISNEAVYVSSFPVRYNEYSVLVRVKSDNILSEGAFAKIGIYGSNETLGGYEILSRFIKCDELEAVGGYKTFYFTVKHRKYHTNPVDKKLYVKVWYYGDSFAHMWLDSITITPIHTSVTDFTTIFHTQMNVSVPNTGWVESNGQFYKDIADTWFNGEETEYVTVIPTQSSYVNSTALSGLVETFNDYFRLWAIKIPEGSIIINYKAQRGF